MFEFSRNDFLKKDFFHVYFGEKRLKNVKKLVGSSFLAILLVSAVLPMLGNPAFASNAEPISLDTTAEPYRNKWLLIETEQIKILFPAGGKKPMFLWWHANDTSKVYVVKYKGLIEYITLVDQIYQRIYQAEEARIREQFNLRYVEPYQHQWQAMIRERMEYKLMNLALIYGLHSPYLPFSACTWNLTGPVEVTRGDVKYLSFNFTLDKVPWYHPGLKFAQGNVIIRCRFYYTPATEDVQGLYSYTVDAGELKMDLIVNKWEWNIDKINSLITELRALGIDVPYRKAGLALWINLATINIEKIDAAEQDVAYVPQSAEDEDIETEIASTTSSMYVEGKSVTVTTDETATDTLEHPMRMQARLQDRYKIRFATDDMLGGYFKFVPYAIKTDGQNPQLIDVKASYISAGSHMRLFLCYPYFGNLTLEHDPSIGLETLPTLATYPLIIALLSIVSIIAIGILAIRWKKGPVNILKPN